MHGNGDSAALWLTTLWRFESNGWPRDRLVALNMPYPSARDDDTKPQPGRSSADDQMRTLAAEVARVLEATGAQKVVLMGNSRGGNAIRAYVQNGGGARHGVARHPRRHTEPRRVGHNGLSPQQRVQRHRAVPDARSMHPRVPTATR